MSPTDRWMLRGASAVLILVGLIILFSHGDDDVVRGVLSGVSLLVALVFFIAAEWFPPGGPPDDR